MTIVIVIISSYYLNAREVAREIKNKTFKTTTELRENVEGVLTVEEGEEVDAEVLIYDLDEFVEQVNDGSLDVLAGDYIANVQIEN